jgi:hypothetical protein
MNTVRGRAKGAVLVCSAGGAAYYHTNSEAEQSRRRLVRERLCQRITVVPQRRMALRLSPGTPYAWDMLTVIW